MASRTTSREALEALAVGIRPEIELALRHYPHDEHPDLVRWVARMFNVSEWTATDLVFEATLPEDRHLRDTRFRLLPTEGSSQMDDQPPYWDVPLATVPREWPDEGARSRATLRWSDSRGIATYERRYEFVMRPRMGPSAIPEQSWFIGPRERIR
jgi:hypothetical protein